MPDLSALYQLAGRWERQAFAQPAGDRYKAGLSICAQQLREILVQMEHDADA